MVCVTITRDPTQVDIFLAVKIRDGLHKAVVEAIRVKAEDVELRVREVSRLDINSGPLSIEIDCGPGKESWRVNDCRSILLEINRLLILSDTIPKEFREKGRSNMWLRIYAKGASMPIGCPSDLH